MAREHAEVRLNRRTFSGVWEAVRIAEDGRTITDRWPICAEDAAKLSERCDFEAGVRQAIEWLRADYPYGEGPEWRENGAEWIAGRLAEWRLDGGRP